MKMARSRTWLFAVATFLLLLNGEQGTLNIGPSVTSAEKILALFQLPAYSHFVVFESLFKELAARGHQVTVLSRFPQKTPLANYTDISLFSGEPPFINSFSVETMVSYLHNVVSEMNFLWSLNIDICEKAMAHPNMKKIIESKERYDLVILETFVTDCCYGVAWKLGAPVIAMTSLARMPWGQFRMGNPDNPAVNPVVYTPFSTRMTFWQRLINSLAFAFANLGDRWLSYPAMEAMNKRIFGPEIPPLDDLLRNTSLTLLNSHFSLHGALPYVPGVVEVAGMHVQPDRSKLSKPILDWLDGADAKGVVFISFGSLARSADMPLPQLRAMVKVLGSLDRRVLWKCDGVTAAKRLGHELASNIFADDWMHQATVLDHPKTRVFVSHGGLGGTEEALHQGVPMLVVPLFSDQEQHANLLEERGMAIKLYFHEVTEENFRRAITTLLDDPKYLENARHTSAVFRDRPRHPLQEAVFWTEYVMRHRGAPHMQSAAVHLRWWQLLLVDVVAVVLAAVVALIAAALLLFRCLCRRSPKGKVKRS